jgi:hypothetical protein
MRHELCPTPSTFFQGKGRGVLKPTLQAIAHSHSHVDDIMKNPYLILFNWAKYQLW